jgi:hypothetical protein
MADARTWAMSAAVVLVVDGVALLPRSLVLIGGRRWHGLADVSVPQADLLLAAVAAG